MKTQSLIKNVLPALLAIFVALFSIDAHAAINNAGILDNVLARYQAAASTWGTVITNKASVIFWSLVVISMVFTFGMMALRKADVGEFFAEFISFTISTGFFWWALTNGPAYSSDIMQSLRQLAATASGNPATFTPSSIVDIGFDIFFKVLDQSSVWSPVDSFAGILIAGIVLIVFALVGVNMLLLLVAAWIMAYAGVFMLGFGGSKWTSDMAIAYYKNVLSIALQLFTMVLLVGIGKSFVDQYYNAMSAGLTLKEISVMLVVAAVLLALVNKVPPMIGQLPFGGGAGQIGNHGAGSALAAAGVASAAMASGGAAMASAATSVAGGASALMAAYSKASANVAAGSDIVSAMSGGGAGGGDQPSGNPSASPLASAMDGDNASAASSASSGGGGGGIAAKAAAVGQAAMAAGKTAGKVAADMGANLASGAWDVSKTKAQDKIDAAKERIGETFGGQVAASINAEGTQGGDSFAGDSLSAGNSPQANEAASEVAAFVNRDQGTGSQTA